MLRAWEMLGLVSPRRTESNYRLYTPRDVRLLKRAQFLRRVRGLNAPAIVLLLKRQGLLSRTEQVKPSTLGSRLRRLRLAAKLSLATVSHATEVSLGFLSAIERGQMNASVATLRRLARYYNINILSLFDPTESNPNLVRPAQRKILEAGAGVRMELLAWGNTVMEPHRFRIPPAAGSGEAYSHEGEEFLYVLRGELEMILGDGERHHLCRGDSFYFESSTRHQWKNPGQQEAVVLWINTPPTF
jgi:transcriptional regulator with XRE-family HTH domain